MKFFTENTLRVSLTADGKIGIGTASPTSHLSVSGTISAKEIIVSTTGADFVFEDDYELPSLYEVESHIQENKHLPGIASAKEMQENGVRLSELNIKLLQKIEELTLYTIQQQKAIDELIIQMNEMKNNMDYEKGNGLYFYLNKEIPDSMTTSCIRHLYCRDEYLRLLILA